MKTSALIFALAGTLCLSAAATAQPLGNADAGRELAVKICSECHAVLPGTSFSPEAAAPTFQTIASSPGMSHIALVSWFQTSHKEMPNIMLETSDKDDLIAYITGLRGASE